MPGPAASSPTPDQILRIEHLAGVGCTLDQIAIACDISESTLKRWRKSKVVERAYERGRIAATEAVADKLFNLCQAGDTTACIFWLKAQAGWKDRPQDDPVAIATEVIVYLPENNR